MEPVWNRKKRRIEELEKELKKTQEDLVIVQLKSGVDPQTLNQKITVEKGRWYHFGYWFCVESDDRNQVSVKDLMLIDSGTNPSNTYFDGSVNVDADPNHRI